jgi:ECF transporter S component (folate family)
MKGGIFVRKINIKTISIAGFLIALNIVLSRIITIPGIINFGGFPIIFGGIVFGPAVGGIIGAVGDIVSFIVRPTGAFMPHFVLTSALTGIIPGILAKVLQNNLRNPKLWKIFTSVLTGQFITSIIMVPYFRQILFGHPFLVTMLKAITKQAVNIPAYSIIILILIKALYKAGALQEAQ